MATSWNKASRTLHRWVIPFGAVPILISAATGVLLLLKSGIPFIQPPAHRGSEGGPTLAFDRVLEISREVSRTVPEAGIQSWKDVGAVDVRPSLGVIRVRSRSAYEIQIDANSGKVLGHGPRRTGILIALHEGSWFGKPVKDFVFLPATVMLLLLWVTGMVLFLHPYAKARRKVS